VRFVAQDPEAGEAAAGQRHALRIAIAEEEDEG
jgi:hypothetical protein